MGVAQMPEIELTAGTIEYEDTGGDGPVLVLLGGLVMDGSVWDPLVADLRRDHRCVVPTLPLGAHRKAMHPDADLSLQGFARMVAELLERLALSDVTLVQNDPAAALVLAGENPDRVARLVISSCESFENYPPGLPGKNVRLTAFVPAGIFLTMQAQRMYVQRLPRQEDAAGDERGQPHVLAGQAGRVVLEGLAGGDHQARYALGILAGQHERGGVVVLHERDVGQRQALQQLGDHAGKALQRQVGVGMHRFATV